VNSCLLPLLLLLLLLMVVVMVGLVDTVAE
jgi:hypothetical protein